MSSKEYCDCKLACLAALQQLNVSKNQMKIISQRLKGKDALAAFFAHGQMIKAVNEAEKALKHFVERDRAVD